MTEIQEKSGKTLSSFSLRLLELFPAYGLPGDPALVSRMDSYYQELLEWNSRFNLTRITGEEEAAVFHFLDSAVAWPYLPSQGPILDIGSGAGFPGLVLALLSSERPVTLLEVSAKKAGFLRHMCQHLKLDQVTVLEEPWPLAPSRKERYAALCSRATFSGLHRFAGAEKFLVPEGRIIVWRGQGVGTLPGLVNRSIPVTLPGQRGARCLLIGERGKKV